MAWRYRNLAFRRIFRFHPIRLSVTLKVFIGHESAIRVSRGRLSGAGATTFTRALGGERSGPAKKQRRVAMVHQPYEDACPASVSISRPTPSAPGPGACGAMLILARACAHRCVFLTSAQPRTIPAPLRNVYYETDRHLRPFFPCPARRCGVASASSRSPIPARRRCGGILRGAPCAMNPTMRTVREDVRGRIGLTLRSTKQRN